ncbi:TPM domain-containing protein [Novosphingobium sp.]|uniref:TPM domain-containing protein n=1 Tax=Novosphingobium sp. TaxID=1874826 RepID=UPI0025ECD367|nr:TPM domain-containing protein [Novosphingobium sp.]
MGPRPLPSMNRALAQVAGALVLLFAVLVPNWAQAQSFPELTGPVVDQANVIPDDQEARIAQKLVALKTQSQRQLQVVTVSSLEGYDIADYANRLFRSWQLGDKQRNDGVMLLIAPNDRKLRIEVGYGMEGIVTDGYSFLVINQIILPKFKAGDMPGGIEAGADALVKQMGLSAEEAQRVAAQAPVADSKQSDFDPSAIVWLAFFFLFFILPMLRGSAGRRRRRASGVGEVILWSVLEGLANSGSHRSSGGGGWSGGGGGWSGGGGSSGGGGASGSW